MDPRRVIIRQKASCSSPVLFWLLCQYNCGMSIHVETTTITRLMALNRAVLVRPKNVGELWSQMASLAGSGWDLAGLAMRAAVTGGRGATEIFPVRWVMLLKSFRRSLAGFSRQRLGSQPSFSALTGRCGLEQSWSTLATAVQSAELVLAGDHWGNRFAALWSAIAGEVDSLLSCCKRDSDCNCHTRGPHFILLPLAVARRRATQWTFYLCFSCCCERWFGSARVTGRLPHNISTSLSRDSSLLML
jgi:hypothetical protein